MNHFTIYDCSFVDGMNNSMTVLDCCLSISISDIVLEIELFP